MTTDDLDAYCASHQDRFVAELVEALRIPSISADPAYAAEVRRNADHFRQAALDAGLQRADLIETPGHPTAYAERIVDQSLTTALIYRHHDVQPVDPLAASSSHPLEREVRAGNLTA